MKRNFLLFLLLLCSFLLQAQKYDTYKRVNDSTYVITSSFDDEEVKEITADAALQGLFRAIDNYYRLKNRKYNQWYTADRIATALDRDLKTLFPDTSYIDYNSRYDSLFAHPSRLNDYDSRIRVVGDSTYNVEVFLTAGKSQVLRIEGDTTNTNYSVRFIEGLYTVRLGNNAKYLPFIGEPIELQYIEVSNDNGKWRTYYKELPDRTKIRFRFKLP